MDPIVSARRPRPYPSLTRDEDYYNEGMLIWLEADQVIRSGSAGRKGLDDFARAFFGMRDGDWGELTYEEADVVQALNAVFPYDWAGFLHDRIDEAGRPAPLAGIERAGYRLVWKDEPNPFDKARMADAKVLNLYHSLGFAVDNDGSVTGTRWDSPAFKAGVVTGTKIVAVNGVAYDPDRLKQAITSAKGGSQPIELLVRRGDRYSFASVAWNGGLRWPWLEKATPGDAPAPLDLLLAPRRDLSRR
jgi:predicted metalloprotease with PDZ domain